MENTEFAFGGYNGIKIYAKQDLVNEPKANVVIVHGIFEHLDRYNYITKKLNDHGYNVYRYDARGHGRSEGGQGTLNNFDEYLYDLSIYINLIRSNDPDLKIILLGHSMGGLVATAYACRYNNKIDYLVLSGACNQTPKIAKALKFIPTSLIPMIKYKNKLGKGVCGDPEVVKEYNSDPLVGKYASLKMMKNVFIKGCEYVNNNIRKVSVPTLVMHGKEDGIVVSSTGEWTYNNLVVKDRTLKMYEGLYHEIFNEVKKDEVIDDLLNWLNERLEGK